MAYVIAAGSPGPLERRIPSGFSFKISSAFVFAGTTLTSHPDSIRHLKMLYLIPKSIATTFFLEPGAWNLEPNTSSAL